MEQILDKQLSKIATKPRNAFIALLLSLLLPGLGQVYNGQPKKAGVFFGFLLFFPILFGLTRGSMFFQGLISLLIIQLGLRIYIIIDGIIHARRQKEYVLKSYNKWYYHLLIAMGMLAILMIYDVGQVLGIQTFNNPTSSNNPTLQIGDYLVTDMGAYKSSNPDYGDIVAFSKPDGYIYLSRVVGCPNDRIEIIDNIVSINGVLSKTTFIKETTNNNFRALEYEEELPNGHKHLIYKYNQPVNNERANVKNIVVPSDSYYLLSDNRDAALDSRHEGTISKDRIKGQAIYSYWGASIDRINIDFRNK